MKKAILIIFTLLLNCTPANIIKNYENINNDLPGIYIGNTCFDCSPSGSIISEIIINKIGSFVFRTYYLQDAKDTMFILKYEGVWKIDKSKIILNALTCFANAHPPELELKNNQVVSAEHPILKVNERFVSNIYLINQKLMLKIFNQEYLKSING